MSRNLKPENLKKLSLIKTSNGFKVDLANYMYNPSFSHEYPNLIKLTRQTETEKFYANIKYFKYHNGTGEYILEIYYHVIDNNSSWSIAHDTKQTELETSNRFSVKRLTELAEQIEMKQIELEKQLVVK